jgi:DNA-binding response OmpR family regulator
MNRTSRRATAGTVQPITVGRFRVLRVNGIDLHLDAYQARVNDQPICLTIKEFELLRTLMEHAGQVQSHRQLLDTVWGADHPDDNASLRVHIMRLRKKLAADHDHPTRIRTVSGHGYIFDLGT